ncbi:putative membrane protein YphA (DoxX/SURF4 family) [Parabacteroides sp. PF5-5]|uniref:BT_3928 family protein n=1 Tax=unclassified Parabacteroides TaxID=2649774 RepID=UPI0024738F4C|nr:MULTISPECIES: BT_3928 family protein [unclassified Parabacteroides]MDH6305763.1 putative membrane protein YphA (DoxX/SURF4 family) [Parabacteroides sp. PH5-39]MDH6316835.1 putative membrane protein YphA (DoxX/SURF4 family) [Parabacteroides sp. PF5-13]MDH6320476.1 putative membrane protein YphA (DoxX/SURF4 family) [Parabacteroides sp. PH5-13]MDH6324206.1 putative membrane protein YphA (DoxX/SURF4 family) [Parabacteroides sp. PH5-8]MDH6328021.1 putative membrane protein YphA (DoxX/SURF4 famil
MMTSYKETGIKIFAEICRLLIGVVFIFSGFVKAVDPVGFAIKIGDYLTAFGLTALKPLALLVALNLVAIEFALGVCMLLGVYRRYTSFLLLLFMSVMTPLTLYLAIFDPVSDCGCFGDAVILTNWETFFKNLVLLGASIFLLLYNQKLFQCFTYKVYWFVALFVYVYCLVFSVWNYKNLPLLDFRPYKIGANIPEQMLIPEGMPEDEYEYIFIYEKDGVRKEFGLDNYPATDSTWTFIDTKTVLITEGYKPPIESFTIYDAEGNDQSDLVLDASEPLLLLIVPKLEDASDERIDEINNVYDYALEHDMLFYCITGSSEELIQQWIDISGAEYPFLFADDVLLKTIIRSNPGLVLMKGGTVLMKWHYRNIPEEEEIGAVLTKYLGEKPVNKSKRWIYFNLFGFIVPLLSVWVYDFLRFRRKEEVLENE